MHLHLHLHLHLQDPPEEGTRPQNMVGVNFKTNPSLRERYGEYLDSR